MTRIPSRNATRKALNIMALGLCCCVALLAVSSAIAGESGYGSKANADQMAGKEANEMSTAMVGATAPDFTLKSVDGKECSLSQYRGKYVVLEWVNFDCPFVKAQYASGNMPGLQKRYSDKDVVWLSVCSSAPGKQGYFKGDELESRMKAAGWSGTAYLIDADGTVGKAYGAKTTPNMCVISPRGQLVYEGAIDDTPTTKPADIPNSMNYVSAALDAAMNGKEIATASTTSYGCGVKY